MDANPFHLLGLTPGVTAIEIERAGQRLLALSEVGSAAAAVVVIRGVAVPRSVDQIRAAMATLRDPAMRARAEFEAGLQHYDLSPRPSIDVWAELGLGHTRPPERR